MVRTVCAARAWVASFSRPDGTRKHQDFLSRGPGVITAAGAEGRRHET